MDRLFESESIAEMYGKYRPGPPQAITDKIMDYLKEEMEPPYRQCLDVGCGSGQSTQIFAPFFSRVIGQDVSHQQVKVATTKNTHQHVEYRVGAAEHLQADDQSCELVCAGSAAHWFDLPQFFAEAERVLVPRGAICLFGYGIPWPVVGGHEEQLQDLVYQVREKLERYWDPRVQIADERYSAIVLPFDVAKHQRDESIYHDREGTLSDVAGYIKSWSAFDKFKKENPEEAINLIKDYVSRSLEVIGGSDIGQNTPVIVRQRYYIVMCRKNGRE